LPILALTAAAFDDMEDYLKRKGFNGVLQKPFKPDDLYAKISKLLEATTAE
jgi:CheY-like chemotaxis protein